MAGYDFPPNINALTEELALKLLVLGFFGSGPITPGGGIATDALTDAQLRATPVPVTATVTSESTAEATAAAPTYTEGQDAPLSQDLSGHLRTLTKFPAGTLALFAKTAGQNETIPVGAFQIGVIFLTGTGTIGGVDWPVGVPFNLEARTAATIAVVCGSPGTARVTYLT